MHTGIMATEIWNNKTFGKRVKNARLDRGMTQGLLAGVISCDPSYISTIEKGETRKQPTPDFILKLALALRVNPGDLLFGGPDEVSLVPIAPKPKPVNRRGDLQIIKLERVDAGDPSALPNWLNAAAGPGHFLMLSEDYWYVPRVRTGASRNWHTAIIRGTSMQDTLVPGDKIVMEHFGDKGLELPPMENERAEKQPRAYFEQRVKQDSICAFSINNEGITIKRVRYQGEGEDWMMLIVADNQAEWPAYSVSPRDHVTIWAKVVGIGEE